MKQKEKPVQVLESLFLHQKPVKMLITLKGDKPKYTTQVSKGVDCTYSHTVKVLEFFRKLGLVQFEKKGRIKIVKLTSDGEDIAHDLEGITRKFSRLASQIREDLFIETQKKEKKAKK